MKKIFICVLSICSLLLAACGNGDKGLLDGASDLTHYAESLVVTPKNASIPVGFTQQMQAEAVLENNHVVDVTTEAALTWQSSDTNIATIDDGGLVTGKALGQVTITAMAKNEDGSIVKDTAVITVSNAVATALQVTPKTSSIPVGLTQAFKAEAVLSDGQIIDVTHYAELTWVSSDTAIATMSNSAEDKGVATTFAQGVTSISANVTVNGVTLSDSAELTVNAATVARLEISPHTSSIPAGFTRQFTATAILSDNTTRDVTSNVQWHSDNTDIATVSADVMGLTQGVNEGEANISASVDVGGSTYSDTASLTVTNAVVDGLLVSPVTASMPIGLSYGFTATAHFSDGSSLDVTTSPRISWTSSDTSIATVANGANKGQAKGLKVGEVTITATGTNKSDEFYSSSATFAVTDATVMYLQLTPTVEGVPVGLTKPFKATAILSDNTAVDVTNDPALSWGTSDAAIATIATGQSTGNGIAKGESTGRATISATGSVDGHNLSADALLDVTNATVTALQVTPPTDTTIIGFTKPFTATALMSDGGSIPVTDDPAIHWTTSDETIARMVPEQNGVARGVGVGETTITATGIQGDNSFEASATLNVIFPPLKEYFVFPENVTLPLGAHDNLMATALFEGDAELAVNRLSHWRSSNDAVVTVGEDGELTSYSTGTATITATFNYAGETYTDTANVTVTAAEVESIIITPQAAEIPKGLTQAFTAKAIYTDDSEVDITTATTTSWASNDITIATISSSGSDKGVAKGEKEGVTTITVNNGDGVTATASLTVTSPVLTSIEVSPNPVSIGTGETTSLIATGYYSDGTEQDITATVGWTGQDTSIATVVGGEVTGVAIGDTSTTASLDGISSEPVTINVNPVLVSIEVSPTSVTLFEGDTKQLTATGIYSDNSSADITNSVTWNVEDDTLAVISQGVSGGMMSTSSRFDDVTTASAQLNGITSNIIDVAVCRTLAGPCIDAFDTTEGNGEGKLYSSSPSIKYLDYIGGSEHSGSHIVETTDDMGPVGEYYLFTWQQAAELCNTYNSIKLSGRTNWKLPSKDELTKELYGANGNMFDARGWPASYYFWTSTAHGSYYYNIDLVANAIYYSTPTTELYVSCVSNP